jgi:hypothetical protein
MKLRKAVSALAIATGLFAGLGPLSPAPASALGSHSTSWATGYAGTCVYRGNHFVNLYNYPISITDPVDGCLYTGTSLIYGYLEGPAVGAASGGDSAVAVGENGKGASNSWHRGCSFQGGCTDFWYHT